MPCVLYLQWRGGRPLQGTILGTVISASLEAQHAQEGTCTVFHYLDKLNITYYGLTGAQVGPEVIGSRRWSRRDGVAATTWGIFYIFYYPGAICICR